MNTQLQSNAGSFYADASDKIYMTQFLNPGDDEEIVNEQEQNEIVNTEEEVQTTNGNG